MFFFFFFFFYQILQYQYYDNIVWLTVGILTKHQHNEIIDK